MYPPRFPVVNTRVFSLKGGGVPAVHRKEGMRRLLPVFTIGFAISSLLVFLLGDSGLRAYGRLAAYRVELEDNVERLSSIHSRLENELSGLEAGSETSVVLAREIGLYREGDRVIRIEGGTGKRAASDVGSLIRLTRQERRADPALKGVGLGIIAAGCAAFLVVGKALRARGRNDRRRS
jgi:hypothetical protein